MSFLGTSNAIDLYAAIFITDEWDKCNSIYYCMEINIAL